MIKIENYIFYTNKLFQRKEELEFFDEIFENKKWNMIKRSSNQLIQHIIF